MGGERTQGYAILILVCVLVTEKFALVGKQWAALAPVHSYCTLQCTFVMYVCAQHGGRILCGWVDAQHNTVITSCYDKVYISFRVD